MHSVHYTRSVCVCVCTLCSMYYRYTIQYGIQHGTHCACKCYVFTFVLITLLYTHKLLACIKSNSLFAVDFNITRSTAQYKNQSKSVQKAEGEKMMQSKRFRNENGNVDLMLQRMRSCLKGRRKYNFFFSGCWNISKHFKWYIK